MSKALYLAGVEVDADDIVQPGKLESVSAGMEIVVNRVTISQESEKQRIPYHVTYQDDDDLYLGKEKMVKQGTEGVKEVTYRVVTVDGVETEAQRFVRSSAGGGAEPHCGQGHQAHTHADSEAHAKAHGCAEKDDGRHQDRDAVQDNQGDGDR